MPLTIWNFQIVGKEIEKTQCIFSTESIYSDKFYTFYRE